MRCLTLTACFLPALAFCLNAPAQPAKADPPLVTAAKQNNRAAVEKLLQQGADINTTDSNAATPLLWAAFKGYLPLFKHLVKKGADYKKKGVIYLDSTRTGYYGNIAGIAAAQNDSLLLAYCLDSLHIPVNDKEYNPESKKEDGWSPLHWAASNGSLATTRLLIMHGAAINETYAAYGNTPLLYAAQGRKTNVISYLSSLDTINLQATNNDGWQVLHYLCRDFDAPDFTSDLVRRGAAINHQTKTGLTPLMLAAYNGNRATTVSLLNLKADASLMNSESKTAYDLAYGNSKYATALCLKKWTEGYTLTGLQALQDSIRKANGFYAMGDSCNKKQLYDCAVQNWELERTYIRFLYGESHPNYATSLNNLAALYDQMGRYDKAMPLYQQVLQLRKEVLGERHPDYALSLANLAHLYDKMGSYDKALPLYQQASDLFKEVLGERHPNYALSLNNLAGLHYKNQQVQMAFALFRQSISARTIYIRTGAKYLSQGEMMHFVKKNNFSFEIISSLALVHQDQTLKSASLNAELLFKGIALQNTKDLYAVLSRRNQPELTKLLDEFTRAKRHLAKTYQEQGRTTQIDSLTTLLERYEQQLVQQSPDYQQLVANRNATWQQMQQKLTPGEAAIEFVQFRYWNKRWTDTTYYAAYLLLPKAEPQLVTLCMKKVLEKRIVDTIGKKEDYVRQLYEVKDRGLVLSEKGKEEIPSLYNLLWQPLDSLLAGVHTVYYAPAGLLHRINPAAIQYSGSKVLGEKYAFHLMGSTRDLVSYQSEPVGQKADTLLLYGGIQFDMDSAYLVQQHKKYQSGNSAENSLALREGSYLSWDPLEGSAEELASVRTLSAAQQVPALSFTGRDATEESFLYYTHQAQSPALIHVATHGFFYSDEQRKKRREGEGELPYFISSPNAMLRSGIVFAGANQVASGKQPVQGIEDGIVTAYDIANANLQNTKLMVLSACETGLGKIENTEGVFGLQRAIRMAGCKNLLMSLWTVPDKPTARFMKYFYTQLLQERKTVYESFRYAQQQMRELYDGQPYFWAGFVLME